MITFDYAQLNKKGLKDVVKWFEKQALPVKEVRGNNVPKRENGFQIKSAEIEFESGQILLVKAKANVPAFFQVKLNNKVLAIRDYKQLDNELREIAAFVKENEPKYSKNQEKAAAKAKIKVDVPKPVVTTTAEQAEAFKASLAELQGQGEALGNQITEVTAQVNQKAGQLADLQSKLDAEKATTTDLEAQIAEFSGSVNAAPASNAPIQHVVTLVEAPRKMAMLETKMRYDVLLNGKFYSELYFNTKGYVGKLPLPSGKGLTIGEVGISAYKKEISRINKDAKAGIMESAGGASECPECGFDMTGSSCLKCGLKRTVFESAGNAKAAESRLAKLGFFMQHDGTGEIQGFRSSKTGTYVSDYSSLPKDIIADMKTVIDDHLAWDDEDGKYTVSSKIKHVFEAAGKVNEKKFYERGHSDGKRGYPKDTAMSQATDGGFAYLSGYADATGEDFPPNKNKGKVFESATKCEYCGAPMGSNDHRCMKCGKTPEQAHMLAGKKNQEVE